MQIVLVTGGAGFIGSRFIRHIFSKNKDLFVINVDKLTYAGNPRNVEGFREKSNYEFVQEDICNSIALDKIVAHYKPDYIVNFAAESHVDRSIQDSRAFVETNVLGAQVLLQSAVRHKVSKFVQISTDEVYGAGSELAAHDEAAPLKPGNPYAASKAAADMLVLSYHHTYGLHTVITRCTNNFGPGQYKEKLIPLVIDRCLNGEYIPVYGDGLQMRDWIYVDDHCDAVWRTIEEGKAGEIYNISADNKLENIVLIKKIIHILIQLLPGSDPRKKRISESLISYVEDRKGHDSGYCINADKIKNQLGWMPSHSFENAFQDTIAWYLKNAIV